MKFHKEGNKIIATTIFSLAVINLISFYFFGSIGLILSLVVSSGLSYKEIAELTGTNETNIKVKIHRSRLKLKKILRKGEP